jgi:hypothetical protein
MPIEFCKQIAVQSGFHAFFLFKLSKNLTPASSQPSPSFQLVSTNHL